MSSTKSLFRPGLFKGKVALVTGGGTGIGKVIAHELASLGATVVIASRRKEVCQAVADEYKGPGKIVAGPSTSIRNEQEIKALISFCVEQCGALDLLVNNGGGQFLSPAADLTARGFAAVVETNLLGTFLMCKEAYKQYMEENGGAIVNITLINRNGAPLMSHSAAARAGVENLSKTLSMEWIESGVRVNSVRPGIIFTETGFANYGDAGDEYMDKLLHSLPARRLGTPQEVSSAVVWLLSEGSSYVTGQSISVDGGGSFTLLPLVDIPDETTLPPYGDLPQRARL